MRGPEHYREAERLMSAATDAYADTLGALSDRERATTALAAAPMLANLFAQAQVHATLAMVAATRGPSDPTWIETLR